MKLMLDLSQREAAENGGNGGGEDARRNGSLSVAARVVLALAAMGAAYFIMTGAWPAEMAAQMFAGASAGILAPIGIHIASLPCL